MRTGVITFHNYDNYGAILQSYALQKKLKEHGIDARIIDYRSPYIGHPFRLVNLKEKGLANYLYGVIGHLCYLPRRHRCNQFRKQISYGPTVRPGKTGDVNDQYDAFITGSDQVWDYKLTHADKTYLLDMVSDTKRKMSYAASFGEHSVPDDLRDEYARLLKRFDRILVRESYGAEAVQQLTGDRPEVVCDPTLLLTGEEWEQEMVHPKKRGRYIAVYQLGVDPSIVRFAKRLAQVTGCRIEYIPFPLVGMVSCGIHLGIGPAEWMGLIHDAEYVVSDSFHGVVFALLFRRPFFTKVDGHHVNRRVQELLGKIGLSGRLMSDAETDDALTAPVEWEKPIAALDAYRESSLRALYAMTDETVQK